MPEYLSAKYLEPFITNELRNKFSSAFSYVSTTGTVATGVDATVLTDICDVMLQARKNHNLTDRQKLIAEQCEIIVRLFYLAIFT